MLILDNIFWNTYNHLVLRPLILFNVLLAIGLSQVLDSLPDSLIGENATVRFPDLKIEPRQDAWFSQDKFLHFSACAALPGLTYNLCVNQQGRDDGTGKVFAVSLTALVSVTKELYDKDKKQRFSWKDLVWDGLGLAVGYFLFVHDF